jgi:membrane associated rhomboid family serine protease
VSAFRLPRLGASPLISQWLMLLIALSIIAQVDGGFLSGRLSLIPSRVWLGEIWRLVTWPLIELGPMSLVVTCVMLFAIGGELASAWGDRRLQRYMIHVVLGAGITTVIVSTLFGLGRYAHLGGFAVPDVLVIAFARQFPTRTLRMVYGMLPLSGQQLVMFVVAVNVLIAIYVGPVIYAPELAACAIAAYYPQSWLKR